MTKDIGTGKGIVAVKSPIDREKFDSLEFNVYAVDGVGTRVPAKVKVKITDVNDNRPVFAKAFHNFEIRYDAPAGTSIGKVTASDADASQWLQCPNNPKIIFLKSITVYHYVD